VTTSENAQMCVTVTKNKSSSLASPAFASTRPSSASVTIESTHGPLPISAA